MSDDKFELENESGRVVRSFRSLRDVAEYVYKIAFVPDLEKSQLIFAQGGDYRPVIADGHELNELGAYVAWADDEL